MDTKHVEFEVVRQDLITKTGIEVEKQALVRTDLKKIVGIVSPGYKIITHKEALDKSISVVEQLEDLKLKSVMTTKGGSRLFAMFESEKEYMVGNLETGKPDNIKLRLTLTNSYDGALKYGFTIGAYRLVCKNGLRTGKDIFAVRQKHTSGLNVNAIMNSARKAVRYFNETTIPTWQEMNKKEVSVENVLKQLEENIPDRLFKEVSETVARKQNATLWELYNDFTYTLTHNEKFNKSYESNDRVQRSVSIAFNKLVTV